MRGVHITQERFEQCKDFAWWPRIPNPERRFAIVQAMINMLFQHQVCLYVVEHDNQIVLQMFNAHTREFIQQAVFAKE